jgi:alkylation response protein AidB-like acyl-CoA dehydrogenase
MKIFKRLASPSYRLTQRTPKPVFSRKTISRNFSLTSEQLEFQRIAKEFSEQEFFPNASKWDSDHIFPVDVFRKAATLGFGGIYVSQEYGGTGLTRLDASLIFEQLSQGCVSSTAYLSIHNMCAWMIDKFGNSEQKKKYLPAFCTMELLSSYCLTEPNSGSDAASLQTKAVKKGDFYELTGEKMFISGGGSSDVYLIMAQTLDSTDRPGISCFIVDKDFPGISFGGSIEKMGWNSQPTKPVILNKCRVPVENRLGEEGMGFKIAMMGLDGGRINIGTCSLGGAQKCFDLTVDYVKQRKQFGNPLASFQNTQFELATMAINLEAMRLMLRNAAVALEEKLHDATMKCAMAKKFATDKGFDVVNRALQLHGGYGYTKEYHIERYFRDLRVHQILEGTNEIMSVIISRNILKEK